MRYDDLPGVENRHGRLARFADELRKQPHRWGRYPVVYAMDKGSEVDAHVHAHACLRWARMRYPDIEWAVSGSDFYGRFVP